LQPRAPGEEGSLADLREHHDIELVRAPNPGPLTLSGTNTWVVGRAPAWVVDPGPLIAGHIAALCEAIDARGGLGGIVLTHAHADHSEAIAPLRERFRAPLAAARGDVDVELRDGGRVGPFEAVATPGHAADHFALIANDACFSGDAVLGEGSVFVSAHEGAMAGYLDALEGLAGRGDFSVICPGHGPAVWRPSEKLAEYIAHRREREARLIGALAAGRRGVSELLDDVWADVPAKLRPAATITLAAHLDKLDAEGRLPEGVERPSFGEVEW
jgi:glyoxylase-like metal-dependent hydrolase (beta-lactamase superfamily II)